MSYFPWRVSSVHFNTEILWNVTETWKNTWHQTPKRHDSCLSATDSSKMAAHEQVAPQLRPPLTPTFPSAARWLSREGTASQRTQTVPLLPAPCAITSLVWCHLPTANNSLTLMAFLCDVQHKGQHRKMSEVTVLLKWFPHCGSLETSGAHTALKSTHQAADSMRQDWKCHPWNSSGTHICRSALLALLVLIWWHSGCLRFCFLEEAGVNPRAPRTRHMSIHWTPSPVQSPHWVLNAKVLRKGHRKEWLISTGDNARNENAGGSTTGFWDQGSANSVKSQRVRPAPPCPVVTMWLCADRPGQRSTWTSVRLCCRH